MRSIMLLGASGSDPMSWGMVAVLAVALVGAGGLLVSVGRKATKGTLSRNRLAGIRTRATLESDAAWDAAHRADGSLITWAGVASLVAGLALLARPSNAVGLVIVSLGIGLMVVLAIVSGIKGNRVANVVLTRGVAPEGTGPPT